MSKKYLLLLVIAFAFVATLAGQMNAFKYELPTGATMNYLMYEPAAGEDNLPLVVFLHGGGEGGDDIELVKKHGFPKLIAEGASFPFYVFAPQNPYKRGLWDDRVVDQMVDEVIAKYPVDPKRVYLVGLSRGGYGVWRMAINHPDKYAAMISICAASIPNLYAGRLTNLPVWFFHGEKDRVVPVSVTTTAYGLMQGRNARVKMTLYPELGHDCWTKTFENEAIYDWLLSFSL